MVAQKGIWQESHLVTASKVDLHKRMRLTAICNHLQEIAGNHASELGMGYVGMKSRGQFWALSRLIVQMDHFPMWLDEIQIQTWVSSIKGPFSHRNFVILSEDGQELGCASSLWALMDMESRRPARIVDHSFTVLEEQIPSCGLPQKIRPLPESEKIGQHEVVFSDLDMIGHVNNVKYVEWIIDGFWSVENDSLPNRMTINYVQETLSGESVNICAHTSANVHAIEVRKKENQQVVCRAELQLENERT